MLSIAAARVFVGIILLALGRRLFWLFVGVVGFVAGLRLVDHFPQVAQPDQFVILFAVVCGLVSMGLAVFVRKVALGGAGFLAGGYLLARMVALAAIAPLDQMPYQVLVFFAGGIVGALLISTVFTWTLIVLSSLGGASLICETLQLKPQVEMTVFAVLAIAGVLFQSGIVRKARREL